MGREYFGDIEGKFGFGIQSSNDIENLINIEYNLKYRYLVCLCSKEEDDPNYCNMCYTSYDEHLNAAKEEECLNEGQTDLYEEDNVILYVIKEKHKEELKKSLEKVEKILPDSVIKKFHIIRENPDIVDGYSDIFKDVANEMNKYENGSTYYFRYKLGIQVDYILNKNNVCYLYCEDY